MIKNQTNKAYETFERIAKSNKKIVENCKELRSLKRVNNKKADVSSVPLNVITPQNEESNNDDLSVKFEGPELSNEKPVCFKKILILNEILFVFLKVLTMRNFKFF